MLNIKKCNKCEVERELSFFKTHHNSKDGYVKVCDVCKGLKEEPAKVSRQERRKDLKANKKAAKKIVKELVSDEDKALYKLVNHFPTFLAYTYSFINLPAPTPLQNRLSDILGNNPERLILQAARGVGKSWITAIFGAWRLLRNKNEKIVIVSGTMEKAVEISSFLRRILTEVDLLNHLEPRGDTRDSVKSFDVQGCDVAIAPSVTALGISGQLVGKRATLVIADDIEIPANSATQTLREKLMQQVKEFENILIPDVPGSVIFLGTPQSMESIYSKLPFPMVILPAKVPNDISIYNGNLDPWILKQGPAGTPTDNVRFNKDILDTKLAGIGLSTFLLQFMLDTSLSDADKYPLKTKDLIVMPLNKEKAPLLVNYGVSSANILEELPNVGFTGDRFYRPSYVSEEMEAYDTIVMGIDPAGDGSDETAYSVIGVKNGNVFVLHVGGTDKGFSDDAMIEIALVAKRFKVNKIIPEKNMGAGMFGVLLSKTLNKIYSCTLIDDFNSSGQKELRIINNLLPLMTNHNLIIDYDVVLDDTDEEALTTVKSLSYSLFYQLTRITRDKQSLEHDDRLDSLAIAIEYIKDLVIVDAEKVKAAAEKEELQNWLNEKIYDKQFSGNNVNIIKKW